VWRPTRHPHRRAEISYAAIVLKGQAARVAYVNEFVEEAKTSGLVMRIIQSLELKGVRIAPPRS
jgi:hypothetical protein